MAFETGIVCRVEADRAWVQTRRSSACEECASKGSCTTGGPGEDMEVEAINRAGAKIGDTVVIEVKTSSVIKLSFMLYIFPIICLILGAYVGSRIAGKLGYNPTAASAICGFLFLAASFVFIKIREKPMSQKEEYRPKIIRIR